jgi:hypothetical protein
LLSDGEGIDMIDFSFREGKLVSDVCGAGDRLHDLSAPCFWVRLQVAIQIRLDFLGSDLLSFRKICDNFLNVVLRKVES